MSTDNARRYVARAIRSVCWQTLRDWELLIFDDGSTDDTPDILRRYASRDARIRLFLNEHMGYVTWLNEGLREARGALWARMDADDVALPHRFEKQVAYLRQHPNCVVVGTDAMQMDAAGWPIGRLRVPLTHEEDRGFAAGRARGGAVSPGGHVSPRRSGVRGRLLQGLRAGRGRGSVPQARRRHFASVTATSQTKHGEALRLGLQSAYRRRGLLPPAEEPLRLRRQVRDATRPEGAAPLDRAGATGRLYLDGA
jgi:glycosyltransferase involved in cell wall biosynthesis